MANPKQESASARPFLKWAGGKRELLPRLEPLLPRRIRTYYEPFLGGGAFFFHLASKRLFQRAVLNDWNKELVNCYRVIRDFPDELIDQINIFDIDKDTYLKVRAWIPEDLSPVRRAARTIYLNKTGFNGLYRVNKKGEFNVPWGKWEDRKHLPSIYDSENIEACQEVLNRYAALYNADFVTVVQDAGPEDVVYFDPPYVPLTDTSNFRSYTRDGFTYDDQERLAQCFRDLAAKGVAVIASNSDTPIVRDLYEGFELHVVPVRRNINSKGDKRGPVNELIIVGRPAYVPGHPKFKPTH